MAELTAILTADGLATVHAALDAAATALRASGSQRRTADQRRADALVAICRGWLESHHDGGEEAPDGGPARRLRPHLQVTVPLSTLLGLPTTTGTGAYGAELAGYGPIPNGLARVLTAEAGTVQVLTTHDATGACLHVGRVHRYRPTRALAAQVTARDVTCRFPGCRRPAGSCDLDHTTPWPAGETCACNLAALCRHHHRAKHEAGWTLKQATGPGTGPGTLDWTSPRAARTYRTAPPATGPPA
jgi:hypothetical protein